MSIWNDTRITAACIDGMVTPFDAANVNPASIDLRLGTSYRRDTDNGWSYELQMPPEGIWLQPGEFVLCCSMETVAIPVDAVAHLYSKSSTGRMGIEHLHAGLGDPGFCGQWTFELHNVARSPRLLVPGKRYMQMEIIDMVAPPTRDYSVTGRYQHQVGATPAREAR